MYRVVQKVGFLNITIFEDFNEIQIRCVGRGEACGQKGTLRSVSFLHREVFSILNFTVFGRW
jgi:hypothetical protein